MSAAEFLRGYFFFILVFSYCCKGVENVCVSNKFGLDCTLDCHCVGGAPCNTDGSCTSCDDMWTGPTCQVKLGDVAAGKYVAQGSNNDTVDASRQRPELAVDSDRSTYSWVHSKDESGYVWWMVDLEDVSRIIRIHVYFYDPVPQNDGVLKRRPGYRLTLSNSTEVMEPAEIVCYQDNTEDQAPAAELVLTNCSLPARYVKLYNFRDTSSPDYWSKFPNLEISDVEVYADKGCSAGTYGEQCDKECRCVNGSCPRTGGVCQGDCEAGYFGDSCNKKCGNCQGKVCARDTGRCSQKCINGYYGDSCNQTCTVNCKDNICLRNGDCISCKGDMFYGVYCNISCSKNCEGGCYQSTGTCKQCINKYYADKCESPCTHCKSTCLRDGTCNSDGCETGYHGDRCEQICDAACVDGAGCDRKSGKCGQCDTDRYGDFCQHICNSNCKDSKCYRNGTCMTGCQDNHFHGDSCDENCNSTIGDCVTCRDAENYVICTKCQNSKYGGDCQYLCPFNCDQCESELKCTQCMPGYSGITCNDKCDIRNCKRCDINGTCLTCEPGLFGEKCEGQCVNGCRECAADPSNSSLSICQVCDKGKFLFVKLSCEKCLEECAACSSFNNCTECVAGRYGSTCNSYCPSNCQECLSSDKCTKCKDGWSGSTCQCSHNCTRDGTLSDWCNSNGDCLKGCVKGKMGTKCNFECPKKDQCLACNQNSGRCTECVSGLYGGLNHCDKSCGKCKPDSTGTVKCDIEIGVCIGPCLDGYYGEFCNNTCSDTCFYPISRSSKCQKSSGTCEACMPGYYGSMCKKMCGDNCLDPDTSTRTCDQMTGTCKACKKGYYGTMCEYDCSTKCSSLKENACDKETGKCLDCEQGFYGKFCDQNCGVHCESACDQDSGECEGCKSKYYGLYCNQTCSMDCGSEDSNGKIVCHRINGECLFCKSGLYGTNCRNMCPANCRKSENFPQCHKADGSCPKCQEGYYGVFCEMPCNKNCGKIEGNTGPGSCNQTTGSCEQGCMPGYHSDMCNISCNATCKDHTCHMRTAECLHGCENGYEGTHCEKEIPHDYTWVIILAVVLTTVAVLLIVGGYLLKRYRNKKTERNKKNDSAVNGRHDERNPLINGSNSIPLKAAPRSQRAAADLFDDVEEEDPSIRAMMDKTKPSDYYDPSTRIMVSQFTEYLQGRKRENPDWYKEDFERLPKGLLKTCNDAMSFSNRGKCRYKQLYPYDSNRVRLEPEGEDKHDFINASYLNGYKKPNAFIAAQGPTDNTVKDFWRMIFQKDCGRIVMLTNLFEECKMKCVRYWPEADEPQTYGKYEVTLVTETELPNYTIRHLQATHGDTKEVKDFQHLHFTAWPDRGVPDNPSIMLNFRDKVMHEHCDLDGPILVHCSAGIGRTGTFVALDYLLRQAHAEAYIDVFNTVTDMRYQRTNFVQTDIQYEFVHNAIVEALNTKECEVTQEQFSQYYWSLLEPGTDSNETKLQEQFRIINEMAPEFGEDSFAAGSCEDNLHKNRYAEILPLDLNRAYLSTPVKGSNDYINAVFVPMCSNKTGFVITQMPLPHTVTDFWRLVYDQHVTNIVMMNNINDDDETIGEYWPSDDSTYGPFRVELLSIDNTEDFSIMNIQLTYSSLSRQNKMSVKLFRYEGWPDDELLPPNTVSLTSLISQVSMSPRASKTEPIIVHCMDGAERSGLFCAVAAVLDRLKMDQKINIPQTILQLRTRRPQLIQSFEQFEFVYRAVLEHLESTQIYSNVL